MSFPLSFGGYHPKYQPYAKSTTVTTISDAQDVTYSAGALIGGLILRDPGAAARSDTTATAAEIISGLAYPSPGSSFSVFVRNTGTEDITVGGGTGVSTSGPFMHITLNTSREFVFVVDSVTPGAEACTVYTLPDKAF